MDKDLIAMNEAAEPGSREALYATLVNKRIRKKYPQSAVEALMRKAIADLPGAREEFAAFNAYVEACKAEARAELGMEVAP
jgi:hypothetical protein